MTDSITKEEIIEHIRNIDKFYEENIFCVENTVNHTLEYLKKKGFIRIEKTKQLKGKKEKVDIFSK
jgi:ribosomal protein S8